MKLNRKRDFKKSGIYCIKNMINGKVYVGKTKCIYTRIKDHITRLNTRNKDENIHLIHAWHKYGRSNFEYFVLEYSDLDSISQKELYWIKELNSLNREKGYNLRYDSSTGLIVSEETRARLRKARKNNGVNYSHKFWQNNPDRIPEMADNVSLSRSVFYIDKYSKQGEFIERYETMRVLLKTNPTYKRHNIYSVCSGEKPSMYGFIWKKSLKSQ